MEALPMVWMIGFLFISIGFSAILTLSKVVFGNLSAQFETPHEADETESKIQEIVGNSAFYEIISMGRLICNATSTVLFYIIRPFDIVTPWPLLTLIIHLFFLWFVLYTLVIVAPTLLGNLRPNSLAKFTLVLYRIVALFFGIPATLVRRGMEALYSRAGLRAGHKFLTEDQRELLESDTSSTEGEAELEDDEKQMIRNIFEFGETPVSEIMTPLANMLVLAHDATLDEVVRTLNNERHSRIPVYHDDKDDIIGVLHNRDFLQWYTEKSSNEFQLIKLVKPAMFVPSMKKIDEVLRDLRVQRSQLAIVVDEYGGTTGLVTLEDIIEEIVGEIQDEDDHDEVAALVPLKDGKFLANPHISLDDLQSGIGIRIEVPEDSHVETLSGLILHTLGSIPSKGTVVHFDEFLVRVIRVEDTRMTRLLIEPKVKST